MLKSFGVFLNQMKDKNKKKIKRGMWTGVLVMLLVVGTIGFIAYQRLYTPNVKVTDDGFLYIPTGATFENVVSILAEKAVIKDELTFRWAARQMKYEENVKPGRYRIESGMSNVDLVSMLRSGKQAPVKLVFNNVRTKDQFAKRIESQLELKSQALLNLMNDAQYLKEFGLSPENSMTLFIPNTYELYWNTTADKFIRRMKLEHDRFWNNERIEKAASAGLTPSQVSILASIVQQESNKEDEKPVIAGVYLNRLKKGWKLEADPTLVFAYGDFTVRRVLNIHKEFDSPYNTYKYSGLPPGPISLPSQKSIDAVLNYKKHDFMYFCAKEDFSGYHNFAADYKQHQENARKFQDAMDRRGIKS